MTASRRDFVQALGAGSAALVAAVHAGVALAQNAPVPPADIAPASTKEGELKIVNFKALALGATVVAVGRPPVLWGLVAGGAPGVKSVYGHIAGEMKSAMMLAGVAKATDIKRAHLAVA